MMDYLDLHIKYPPPKTVRRYSAFKYYIYKVKFHGIISIR